MSKLLKFFPIKLHYLSKDWNDIVYFNAIKFYITSFPISIFFNGKTNKNKMLAVYWLLIIMTMVLFLLQLPPSSPVIQSDCSATDRLLPSGPILYLHQLRITLSCAHNILNITILLLISWWINKNRIIYNCETAYFSLQVRKSLQINILILESVW